VLYTVAPFMQTLSAGSDLDTAPEPVPDDIVFPVVAAVQERLGDQAFGPLWAWDPVYSPPLCRRGVVAQIALALVIKIPGNDRGVEAKFRHGKPRILSAPVRLQPTILDRHKPSEIIGHTCVGSLFLERYGYGNTHTWTKRCRSHSALVALDAASSGRGSITPSRRAQAVSCGVFSPQPG
jgi:hypothetical protein